MLFQKLPIFGAIAILAIAMPQSAESRTTPTLRAMSAPVSVEEKTGMPIIVGRSYTLKSHLLGDTRRLNVWLPTGYEKGKKAYPILLLLDGGVEEDFLHIASLVQIMSAYGQGQELIVIGIEGVDRRQDLSPPTDDPADLRFTKAPGGAKQYQRFLAEEVKPWIKARYRTNGRSALMGESLAGLFVLDTLANTPETFNDYIAVSPALWWNNQFLSRNLENARPITGPNRRVFVAFEGSIAAGTNGPTAAQQAEERVERSWRNLPNVTLARFADERHNSIYHPAALAALRSLYATARPEAK
jgi:uncharacterized protein